MDIFITCTNEIKPKVFHLPFTLIALHNSKMNGENVISIMKQIFHISIISIRQWLVRLRSN